MGNIQIFLILHTTYLKMFDFIISAYSIKDDLSGTFQPALKPQVPGQLFLLFYLFIFLGVEVGG